MADLGGEISALLVASRALSAASAARFHPSVQPAAYQLAVAISAKGSAKAGQLAELLDMDKSAISRLAKSLCEYGLAQSSPDPVDKRSTIYSLTNEGRERLKASNTAKAGAFFGRLEGWSEDELAQFISLLRKFNRG
ncbi:MarR family winged helix-turn-helix transcriptional regulator [Neorhizobium lilium]|uniref:MarR family winged helix-turn-helix transcriptional regulator n=1 Tax=Neorhizobium lilium TaxID=2503024 RepID=UPI0013E2DFBB|nr:MarR family winged helix-turn-helix transcriptional regulator [Neorhizobium lilium]